MNSTIRNRLTPKNVGDWIKNNTNILLMFVLIIVGAIVSENFFKASNLFNVLRQITVNGMLAVACTMTLLVNGFDLSIGHNMALCAVLCIGFEKSYGGVAAIIVALAAGATMGLVNGLLVKLTRGESSEGFMITLASGMMAQALAKWYCGGSEIIRPQIPESQDWFRVLGQGNTIGGFPVCALIWIAVMVILQIIVKKTTFGRKMLLSGANKKSAYLAGINVGAIKVIAYTVAGLCCGIAAIIYAARFNSANDGSGTGGDFNGAVISIIGGNALYGGHGGMVQVFIGAVTFGLITNILQLMGISSAVQFIVQGAILLLAINLDRLKKR